MHFFKKLFNKKTFFVVFLLYLFDVAIGTFLIQYFDVVTLAKTHSAEVLGGLVLIVVLAYLFKKRVGKKQEVQIEPLVPQLAKEERKICQDQN